MENLNLSKADSLRRAYRKGYTAPPRISVADWADRYRRLAPESGSTQGNWSTETVEIARGPMLAVTEPGVHTITVMSCTQLLKTAFLENIFGFYAHLDPCPILLLQPKDEAANQFSKERITPLVRVTPVLRNIIGSRKTRKSDDTLDYKSFPGGFLAISGAGSPDNLARRPVRIILADEVDKYPVTREGDPIVLAEERTATFGVNWLSVRACSPTIEEESRIERSYKDSDERRASVECPHCGHRMFLDFFKHVDWEKKNGKHLTKTARIYCESCGSAWAEGERLRSLKTIRWHQTKTFECCDARHTPLDEYDKAWREDPEGAIERVWQWSESNRHAVYMAKCSECGALPVDNAHAGFQCGKMFSPWQKDKPSDIAKKWIDAQGDHERLQAWWNTQMGLAYRLSSGKQVSIEKLAARGEVWEGQIPEGVGVLTCGIDVQDYRVEMELVGWGKNEESWSINYHVIDGEFSDPATQNAVDAYLLQEWKRRDGMEYKILGTCIDSGGHHTQEVYNFCKARIGRRIWAIKGESARSGERNPVWPAKRPTSRTKKTYRPIILGVNAAKDTIRQRLAIDPPDPGVSAPGYMHFPSDRDINYYAQLTSERITIKESSGKKYRVWELPSNKANEALDCRVYAYGALCGLLHFGLQLNKRVDYLTETKELSEIELTKEENKDNLVKIAEKSTERPKKKSLVSRLA